MKTLIPSTVALCISTATLLLASPVQAAVMVSQSDKAPGLDNIYKYREIGEEETPNSLTIYNRTGGAKRLAGQQFNTSGAASTFAISGVTFYLSSASTDALGQRFRLRIFEASSVTTNPTNATDIFTDTGTLPLDLSAQEYVTFSFGKNVNLSPDKYYTIVFEFLDTTGSSGSIAFRTVGADNSNTPLNRIWADTGAGNWGYASASNGFVTYIHGAEAIPEPGTAALFLGLGVSGLAWQRLRRKNR